MLHGYVSEHLVWQFHGLWQMLMAAEGLGTLGFAAPERA